MTKQDAIEYMISEIEKIEKDRLLVNVSIDAQKRKKEVVNAILGVIKDVKIDDEDQ